MTHYDLSSVKQLIEFDKECAKAASICPQVDYLPNTSKIINGKRSSVEIFESWRNDDTLWRFGYCDELPRRVMKTFEFLREYGISSIRK